MIVKDKVVIVTGAGGGLGKGIAEVCIREGAKVVISDIRGDAAQSVADNLGDDALGITCDVSKDDDLHNLVDETVNKFGRIDGLVNNAGINFAKAFFDTEGEDWDRVISVDLKPAFFLTQYVARRMLEQSPKGGSVIMISSVHSYACLPGAGPYDAAKWGVVGLAKSIAIELATQGVRVNAISPGLLDTQMWDDVVAAAPSPEECHEYWNAQIPMGRVIDPQEIGELAVFLLSDRSQAMTGSNIIADAGMSSQLISKAPYDSKAVDGC